MTDFNDTYHRWIGGQNIDVISYNRFGAFGHFLLEMSLISKTAHYQTVNPELPQWYEERILQLGNFLKSILVYHPEIDAYLWDIEIGYVDNDISHMAIELDFMIRLFENDLIFTEQDMQRFANALIHHFWKNPNNIFNAEVWFNVNKNDYPPEYRRYLSK